VLPSSLSSCRLLPFLIIFFFLLLLTCSLLLNIDAGDLSSFIAQAGAPSHVRPGQRLTQADTAVRLKKVLGLRGLTTMELEAHRPRGMLLMIQRLACMQCKTRAAG